MALRKNTSRNSDRVKIKKMHAQGFSVLQIEQKLSITPEHITYILEQYEDDLGKHKKAQAELDAFRAAEKQALAADAFKPAKSGLNLAAITAQIRADIMAELASGASAVAEAVPDAPASEPVVEEFVPDAEAKVKDEAPIEKEAAAKKAEEQPKPRPRRKIV